MKLSKFRSHRCIALGAVVIASIASSSAQELSYLRGYGHVRARIGVQRAVFECESDAKADILQGKMLADMFWDAGTNVKVTKTTVHGHNVTLRSWAPYGSIAVIRNGKYVIAVGAEDDAKLVARLEGETDTLNGTPISEPTKPYPKYLDMYDLRAVKAYTYAMRGNAGYALDTHWPFLKKFGMNVAFQSLIGRQSPAPGVFEYAPIDYEFEMANKNDGLASVGLIGGGEVPLWVYNRMPFQMTQPSPTSLLTEFLSSGGNGAHFESWGMTAQERAQGGQIFLKDAMKRYVDNPALGAWQLYAGSPGAEIGFHDRYTQFLDYSPSAQSLFRAWLQNVRHFDLATLGQRWYGDASKYSNREQVTIPDSNSFYGALGKESMLFRDGWQLASARDGNETPPPPGDPAWNNVQMPPSQDQLLLPAGEAFFRLEFDSKSWPTYPEAWLVIDAFVRGPKPVEAWMNREKLGEFRASGFSDSLNLVGHLRPGMNELIIRVPRGSNEAAGATNYNEGRLNGPVFMTRVKPVKFPELGPYDNARFLDFHEWQAQAIEDSHIDLLNTALAIDPNHPVILSGGAGLLGDKISDLAEKYATGAQFTGREGYYNPWWSGIGLLGGFYGTSEESAQTSATGLTRELGWMLFDADSNHCMFLNLDLYQKEEQASGWFTKHKRALELIGKYNRVMPSIANFYSMRAERNGSREPINWDLGRGGLQAAHFDGAYATETQILNGEVDKCSFLLDDGTDSMDPDVLNGIKRYIQNGGTFIALFQTGLKDTINSKVQPLSALTGMTAKTHPNAPLKITGDSGLLKNLQGRTVSSQGMTFVPADASVVEPGSNSRGLAAYDDGKIAMTVRQIGKGRIVQIGATYWRDQGPKEAEFLTELLTDLGVKRNADANNPKVWVRKMVTKNGLKDLLVAYNNDEKGPQSAEVKLAVAQKPEQVTEEISGQSVPFTYADGWVTIPNVSFEASETHIFGMKHADLANGLAEWWSEKKTYWRMPSVATSPAVEAIRQQLATAGESGDPDVIAFKKWKFMADRTGSASAAPTWTAANFDDHQWQDSESHPWNIFHQDLADWHGVGLYRSAFNVPANWADRRVLLNMYSYDLPIVYDQAEFYLNGSKVADYKAHTGNQTYAYDVTPLLKPTGNVLTVKVTGGKDLSGLIGNVWLQPELKLNGVMELGGTWQTIGADFKPGPETTLPGKPVARSLSKVVEIPTSWQGKMIYLHLDTGSQWVGSVVVNGHLINTNSYLHLYGPRFELNLTPYIKEGKNKIELWPAATIPASYQVTGRADTVEMPVTEVRLGIQ